MDFSTGIDRFRANHRRETDTLTAMPKHYFYSTFCLAGRKIDLKVIAVRGIIILTVFLCPLSPVAAENDAITRQYIALALQGRVSQADSLFGSMAPHTGSALDQALAEQYQHRFVLRDEGRHPGSGNALVDQLLATYRQYWTRSMMGELSPGEGSDWLVKSLYNLLVYHNDIEFFDNIHDIFSSLDSAIEQAGYYSDHSFSSPWYDLVIWKTQQRKSFLIELTDRKQAVDVVYMDDFYSIGWSDFATLGMTSTGGWAARDALYCVSWAWDQDSEHFRVSFLQHEGRHVADFEQFPRLHIIDLEYRAKLTELAFASSTLPRILKKFTDNGSLNPDSPHAYANYRVSRDLYQALFNSAMPETGNPWQRVNADKINPAARALLNQHTRLLENEGPLTTAGVVYKQKS